MNSEPNESQTHETVKVALPAKRRHIPWLVQGSALLLVVGVFGSISLPFSRSGCARGAQTKALAQAKQIGLALKLCAEDHDGIYPARGVPTEMKDVPASANAAFACLFPTYTTSEQIFGNALSAYQTHVPDNVIDDPGVFPPRKTLEAGENVYGYVMGLSEASNPSSPLVVDGTDGTGHYRTDPKQRGGVWKGERAVVIRLDNSGALEALEGPADARTIRGTQDHPAPDLSRLSEFGKDVRLLDPAVAAR